MISTIAVAGKGETGRTTLAGRLIRHRRLGPAPPHDDRTDAAKHLRAHEGRVTGIALTGPQIHKRLSKTNCKERGAPTCLAVAMKLAQKSAELDKCPYVSDEAKVALGAAAAAPIKLVAIGSGDRSFEVGDEVALFGHEKTSCHRPGLVVRAKSDDPVLADTEAADSAHEVERVGLTFTLGGIAVP